MKKYSSMKNRLARYAEICIFVALCVAAASLLLAGCADGSLSGKDGSLPEAGSRNDAQEAANSSDKPGEAANSAEKAGEMNNQENGLTGGGNGMQNDENPAGSFPGGQGMETGKQGAAGGIAGSIFGMQGTKAGTFLPAKAYREKGIENPPDSEARAETYSGAFLNGENKIELITFCPWMETGGPMLCSYRLNGDGKSWERKPLTWTNGLKGKVQQSRITVLFGQDRKYYAYYCDEEQLYHMVRQEGDGYEEIVIADWGDLETHKYYVMPGAVGVLANGNIVMVDTVGNCFLYGRDGADILAAFRCGWCETLCVSSNEIFVLDHESSSILHYDGEGLEMLPLIEGDFDRIVRLSVFENRLFACSPEGVFAADLSAENAREGEKIFRKWLDAGKFHFSKQNGYPLNLYSLGETFYIIYAEEWGRLKKYVPKEAGEEFAGTMTVYSLENSELVIDMIAEFQLRHPEIEVRYETEEGAQGSTLFSDRIRALNARILAGDGPDILILDGLPAQSYVKKEILADLSEVLIREELQENIVSNYVQGDKIYMLPMRFMIPMIATSGQNVEIFGTLAALAEYCEKEDGNQVVMPGVPYQYILEILYYNFPQEIVTQNGEVSRENIAGFIRQAGRFCKAEQAVASAEISGKQYQFDERNGVISYFSGDTLSGYRYGYQTLSFLNMTSVYDLGTYPQEVELHGGALLGNKGIFFPNGVIGVNAHSEEKEAAFLFVEEVFSREMQQVHSSGAGFSLHKEVLAEDAKVDLSDWTGSYGGSEVKSLHYFNRKDAKQMVRIAQVVRTPVERNQPVFEIVREAVCACLRGEISEQAAEDEIVERLKLYYFEQDFVYNRN